MSNNNFYMISKSLDNFNFLFLLMILKMSFNHFYDNFLKFYFNVL